MTRVAVTGASGFCGGVVARAAAAAGHEVVCLGRRPGPVGAHRPWDAAAGVPDLDGVDVVLHLAAAVGDPRPGPGAEAAYAAVNAGGTARLLGALGGRRLVWVSSASVYAPAGGRPLREDHPATGGRSVYGRTKAAGERLALDAGAVVLRPRAVYGHGDPHLLPRLRGAVRGRTLLLPGPDTPMSLTAVENLAAACLAAAGLAPDPAPAARTPVPMAIDANGRDRAVPNPAAGGDGRPASGSGRPPGAGRPWTPGAYNIADAVPYRRDAVVRAVLGSGVRVRHVPVSAARAAAAVAVRVQRRPVLTPYAVAQLADGVVLDIGRALAEGYRPVRDLDDYLEEAGRGPRPDH